MIKKIYCLILSGFYCFSFCHADKNEKTSSSSVICKIGDEEITPGQRGACTPAKTREPASCQ
jgi:hypothetical protein